jgi:chromosome segregation ATPase
VAELRRQVEQAHGELAAASRAKAESRARETAATAAAAAEAASRAELKALLGAAEARLEAQQADLRDARAKLSRLEAGDSEDVRGAAEEHAKAARAARLADAEAGLGEMRVKYDAERYERRKAEGLLATAREEAHGLSQREAKLAAKLGSCQARLLERERERAEERVLLEQAQAVARMAEAERSSLKEQLRIAEQSSEARADSEGKLLTELYGAKRQQAEAERAASELRSALAMHEARVLAAEQRVRDAQDANVPLRQQAKHALDSVGTYEAHLKLKAEELVQAKAQIGKLEVQLEMERGVEAAQREDALNEAKRDLKKAQAEIHEWKARHEMLWAQLGAEKSAQRHSKAQLSEAQGALTDMKEQIVMAKEAELAEAHRELREQQSKIAGVAKVAERATEQLSVARAELKMRAEQQRLLLEKLSNAQDALLAKEKQLAAYETTSKAFEQRAEGANGRVAQSSSASTKLQDQLTLAYDKLAALAQDVKVAREREESARSEALARLADNENLAAELHSARARVGALEQKVRVSREARMHVQQVLEQRETQLKAALAAER